MSIENSYEVDIKKLKHELRLKTMLGTSNVNSTNTIDAGNLNFHISELMIYDDEEFIINLYKALLKREPDHDCVKFYLRRLKEIKSKTQIIKQILYSPEGRSRKVEVQGLFITSIFESIQKRFPLQIIYDWLCTILFLPKFFREYKSHIARQISIQFQFEDILEQVSKLKEENIKLIKLLEEQEIKISNIAADNGSFTENNKDWDQFYSQFEEKFRGNNEEIKKRLSFYLPIVAKIGIEDLPVIDMGCGSGEWLEILKENNISALGVDTNKTMIEKCKLNNLEVIRTNVQDFFANQPSNSIRAVTGFHIIEHLPFTILMNLLNEIYRCLVKGGAVILETPNPRNISVGSCSFYQDPTHLKPLPPTLMEYLLNIKGFNNVNIIGLNDDMKNRILDDNEVSKRFNEFFYASQDYAVIGYK